MIIFPMREEVSLPKTKTMPTLAIRFVKNRESYIAKTHSLLSIKYKAQPYLRNNHQYRLGLGLAT